MPYSSTPLVRRLLKSYRAYLRGGEWAACEHAYADLTTYVSTTACRTSINRCIEVAIEAGLLTPERVARYLRRQSGFADVEQAMAHELGIARSKHVRYLNRGTRATQHLRVGTYVPGCTSTDALVGLLQSTHRLVHRSGSSEGPLAYKRARRQTRRLAIREVERRCYVVGMLLGNGEKAGIFNTSYAISGGAAAIKPKRPGRFVPLDLKNDWRDWGLQWPVDPAARDVASA